MTRCPSVSKARLHPGAARSALRARSMFLGSTRASPSVDVEQELDRPSASKGKRVPDTPGQRSRLPPRRDRPVDLADHLARLASLLAAERDEEKARLADAASRLTLAEREARGLALADVEAVDEAVLAGRALVTYGRPGRPLGASRIGVGALVRVELRRETRDDAPSGVVARRSRDRVAVAFDEPPPDWATDGRVALELVPSPVTWERLSAGLRRVAARGGEALARAPGRRGAALPSPAARAGRFPRRLAPGAGGGARPRRPGPRPGARPRAARHRQDHRARRGDPARRGARREGAGRRALQPGRRQPARAAGRRRRRRRARRPPGPGAAGAARPDARGAGRGARGGAHRRRAGRGGARAAARGAQAAREAGAGALQRGARRRAARPGAARRGPARSRSGPRRRCSTGRRWCWRPSPASTRRCWPGAASRSRWSTRPPRRSSRRPSWRSCAPTGPCWPATTCSSRPPSSRRRPRRAGSGVSLFERLVAAHGDAVEVTLAEQHRMNEAIMRFPSEALYGGACGPTRRWPAGRLDDEPLLFVDTAGPGFEEGDAGGLRVAPQRGRGGARRRRGGAGARARRGARRRGGDLPLRRAGAAAAAAARRAGRGGARGRHGGRLPGAREGGGGGLARPLQRRGRGGLPLRRAAHERGHHPGPEEAGGGRRLATVARHPFYERSCGTRRRPARGGAPGSASERAARAPSARSGRAGRRRDGSRRSEQHDPRGRVGSARWMASRLRRRHFRPARLDAPCGQLVAASTPAGWRRPGPPESRLRSDADSSAVGVSGASRATRASATRRVRPRWHSRGSTAPLRPPPPGLRSSRAPPHLSADERHRPLARAPALVAGRRHLGRPRGPPRAPRRRGSTGACSRRWRAPARRWPAATPGRSPP